MKALVTGGAGFIGSHIVDRLVSEGHEVAVVDDLSTGKTANLNPEAEFHRMGVQDKGLKALLKDIDVVFHLAAQSQVRVSLANPVYDASVNIGGSVNLLEACRGEVEKIVYASSGGAVYGEPEYLPVDEKHGIAPLSPYGVSKFIVEKYLGVYQELYGLPYAALRYGNVYGPRQDPYGEAGVVAIFAGKMLQGEPPIINGDGEQTRDFVYVSDVVDATLLGAGKKAEGAINIGSGKESSVNDVYRTIKTALSSRVEATHGPAIKGEVNRIFLNVKKAENVLGWRARVSLREGVNELLKCLRG